MLHDTLQMRKLVVEELFGAGVRILQKDGVNLVWRSVGLAYRLAKGFGGLPRDGLVGRAGAVGLDAS
jgi:hypothetical protein